jgi:(R,R)-butanediol dehydrogenase / meso-butanediol dehydrogenase / diacetyl reductase
MLAAVLYDVHDLRLEDVVDPVAGTGEVVIAITHNGLCGSDLKLFEMGLRAVDQPHPLTRFCGPQILGHEFSGVVAEVGEGVTSLKVGDRVCVQPDYHCGVCAPCQAGFTHLCQIITFHGVISAGGGLSQKTAIPASMVHRLPDSLTMQQGALIEPMAVSYHAVDRAQLEPSTLAVVVGAGPIGLGVVLNLKARGVEDIVVIEPSAARRAVVETFGATAVDPADTADHLRKRSFRGGADVAFDCAGTSSTFGATLACLRARGQAVIVAGSSKFPLQTTAHLLQHTEISITGSVAFVPGDFDRVMELMEAGAYPTDGWVEHVPLAQVLTEGFEPLLAGRKTKVLIDLPVHG